MPDEGNKPVRGFALEGVTVRFGRVEALKDLNLSVEPGEQAAVIGASGAGKSTLFNVLTRNVPLAAGRVTVGGRDLFAMPARELKAVRRQVGLVHQAYNLIPQLSVGMNAALGEIGSMSNLRLIKTLLLGPDAGLTARVSGALDRLGLGEQIRTRTADVSGGQQQRAAVARLLVQSPGLVLADEPFAAVDPVTTDRVIETLAELNREGATLLINLHDVEVARRFPRVVALREGGVVFDGSPEQLTEERLGEIYAGETPGSVERGPEDPEVSGGVTPRKQDPARRLEGRDGLPAR